MSDKTSSPALAPADEFASTSFDQWKTSLDKILKGAPFEKKMVIKTFDGIDIQPLYTEDDCANLKTQAGLPGFAPYTRANTVQGRSQDGWDIRQIHAHPDRTKANQQILDDLERGVTSLVLQLDQAARAGKTPSEAPDLAGRDGVMVYSADCLDDLLEGVLADLIALSLEAGAQGVGAAGLLKSFWEKRAISKTEAMGAFNIDPLGVLAATGHLPQSLDAALDEMGKLAKETALDYPNVTTVKVDTTAYFGAGATETQDLAIAMATGVAYLRCLTEAGLSVDEAANQMVFQFTNGADFFPGICKLRAARTLWAHILKASGASEDTPMTLHAATSARALSKRDPWVNMLRTTATCFAGAIGGADHITVLPFDYHCGVADDFARRIARNTQVVLQEESSLNKVIDPAGGSWFMESLTNQYVEKAWALFQDIEAKGGMASVLKDGFIQDQIDQTWAARLKQIATRKVPVTGVSEFPNILEEKVERTAPDYAALAQKIDLNGVETIAMRAVSGEPETVQALPARRLGEAFEALRDKADAFKAANGSFPSIFSANMGAIAQHTARATFAKNFFEAGGIQALSNNGFKTASDCATAFKESGAKVAVLCGSDDQYEEGASAFAIALKEAGALKVYLAGRGDFDPVDETIGMGSDLLTCLETLQTELGV